MAAGKKTAKKGAYVCVTGDGCSFTVGKTYHHLNYGDRIELTDEQARQLLAEKLIVKEK